jgi:hypothetical protein
VVSLMTVYKSKGKIYNPYTRERFDAKTMNDVITMGYLIAFLFPEVIDEEEKKSLKPKVSTTVIQINEQNRHIRFLDQWSEEQRELFLKLQTMKTRTVSQRMQDLFMEIDLLGNYTQCSWFSSLEKNDYIRFFRCLYDVWSFRAQLCIESKKRICQLYDPFHDMRFQFRFFQMSKEQMQEICLNVMEAMVHTGVDTEYRKIGTLHVLSVLTIVSMQARNSMTWLYDSLIY